MDLDFLLGEHKKPQPPISVEPKESQAVSIDRLDFARERGRDAYDFLGGVYGPNPPRPSFRFESMNQAFREGYIAEYEKAQQEITTG